MSEAIRDLFNTARDHDDTAETLVTGLDVASYAAGYTLSEYADAVESMAHALRERLAQLREEIGDD